MLTIVSDVKSSRHQDSISILHTDRVLFSRATRKRTVTCAIVTLRHGMGRLRVSGALRVRVRIQPSMLVYRMQAFLASGSEPTGTGSVAQARLSLSF